jgi:hypothetical protein
VVASIAITAVVVYMYAMFRLPLVCRDIDLLILQDGVAVAAAPGGVRYTVT